MLEIELEQLAVAHTTDSLGALRWSGDSQYSHPLMGMHRAVHVQSVSALALA